MSFTDDTREALRLIIAAVRIATIDERAHVLLDKAEAVIEPPVYGHAPDDGDVVFYGEPPSRRPVYIRIAGHAPGQD